MPDGGVSGAGATGVPSYLEAGGRGWRSWLLTTDHKRIGVLYLVSVLFFFVAAMALGGVIRIQLLSPDGLIVDNGTYNRILTLHGVTMIFLFIIPGVPAILGNFMLPIMIGAEDVAFPRLNLASWYFFIGGAVIALASIAWGGPDTGWTFYVPYSVQTPTPAYLPLTAVFIIGWSSILTGLNFITTVHRLRNPRMPWSRIPLFVWNLYATSWIQVIATPVVGILALLVIAERVLGVGIFDPTKGGDPLLYEHIFWIYSHPAVYIMVLPAMGIVSDIIPAFTRRTIFGYGFMVASSLLIAFIGSLVWAHHMFTSGISDQARVVFSLLTFLVAVPTAIKVFNWVASLYGGSIDLSPPLVLALLFIAQFAIGGLTGLILGSLAPNIHLHDTAFVVAHFHYTMFGGAASAFFAGLFYWFPKMFGRMWNRKAAWTGIALFFVGFNLTYFPLFLAGVAGMPRRYAQYLPEYEPYHVASTIGSWFLIAGLLTLFANLIHGALRGPKAAANPWGGQTLEWKTSSPPPVTNFVGEPDLSRQAYDYPEVVER
jgi:cytochrome c oxidase subunit 1